MKNKSEDFEDDDNFSFVAFLTKTLFGKEDISNKSSKPKESENEREDDNMTM